MIDFYCNNTYTIRIYNNKKLNKTNNPLKQYTNNNYEY